MRITPLSNITKNLRAYKTIFTMKTINTKLGYIIVTFNGEKHIEKLLKSIPAKNEIVVVDNASTDNTLKHAKKHNCNIIKNKKNRGYAAGINQGIKYLSNFCSHFFILNQDTEIETYKMEEKTLLENDIVQPLIILPNRTTNIDSLSMNTFGFVYNKNFRKPFVGDKPKKLQFFSGSAFIISKKTYDEIGEFDESLFMYYEDVDYAIRCLMKNKKIILSPDVVVKHQYKNSFNDKTKKDLLFKNRKIIANRYFPDNWRRLIFIEKTAKDKYSLSDIEKEKFGKIIKPHLLNGFYTSQIPLFTKTIVNLIIIPYSWGIKLFF